MITAENRETSTKANVSCGNHHLVADTAPPKGEGDGFRPHELLEAALASCMAITMRIVATEHGIPLELFNVKVELDRTNPDEVVFRPSIDFEKEVSMSDKKVLLAAAASCPVSKTLAKRIILQQPI